MVRSSGLSLFAASVLAVPVLAGVQEVFWDITYVDNINPDGRFPRRVIGVNNTWPPPPLDVSTNDTLIVHATNKLDEVTSLHHHGMFFNSTTWYDGAVQITQCGIPPGATFSYVVPVNSSGQFGTYWVHSHFAGQYIDGLRAPLLLHPETEVHSYDEEFTIILSEWYHDQQPPLSDRFLSIANPGGAEPVPKSGLLYVAQNTTYLPGFNENATIPFEPGKTYRLRIINVGGFAMFYFHIDGHDMRIIEVDGTDVEESPIDVLSVTVAQRYSVLVTARNDTDSNYAIHANMDVEMFDNIPADLNPNVTSSITYSESAPLTNLGTLDASRCVDTNDTALVPIVAEPLLPPPTRTIPLLVIFDTTNAGTNRAMFNNITFNSPIVPNLFSALTLPELGDNAEEVEGAYGPWAYVLQQGDIVELQVMNSDAGKHPFHLHGFKFQIVHRAIDYTSDDPELNPPFNNDQANPIRRDTVQAPPGSSVTLRFVADNPGVWLFHCHIEWHVQAGLSVSFITAPDQLLERAKINGPPQFMYDQCAQLGVPVSGNAAGLNSTTDLTGLDIGPFLQDNGFHAEGYVAMAGCVVTALLGMATVVWYALGERLDDREVEEETRRRLSERDARGGLLGRLGIGRRG